MRRWIAGGSLVLLFGAVAFIAHLFFNVGLPFGYYGELNRLTSAMESLPGVSIHKVGYNSDVTLEEITMWIDDAHGYRRKIDFGQDDPIRDLSGKTLTAAVAARLAE